MIFPGAFRKVTKAPQKPKSVKANDSFWEPDNDTYVDQVSSPGPSSKILSLPKCPNNLELPSKPPQPKELRLAKDERRQSIEEFIEMGLSNPTSPTKVYIEALDQIPLPPVELGTRDSKKIVIKVDDLDSLKKGKSSGKSSVTVVTSNIGGGEQETFLGSNDYYEAYDPEEVSKSGQAVITTETIPVEAICFLCGSAG